MNILYIYILFTTLAIMQTKWDKINKDTKFAIVVLSASNKYLTNFRLKTAIKIIENYKYKGTIYLCGKNLGNYMENYLVNSHLTNKTYILNSRNTSQDAELLKKSLLNDNQNILLITSISHQRRAYNSFKKVFMNTNIVNSPAWNELISVYSPLLPTGWVAALINTIKDIKYNSK